MFRALNAALTCPGLAGVLLHFPRYNSGCSAPPHHPKTSEEPGGTSAMPKGSWLGQEAGLQLRCTYSGLQWVPVEFPVAPVPAGQVYFDLSQKTVTSQWVVVPNREI